MSKQRGNPKRYKAWYYSLAVCVVACFVAAFSIFGSSPTGDVTSDIVTTKTAQEQEVAAKADNVPDTRSNPTEPAQTTAPQTSEPEEVIANDLVDFSQNIPYESSYVLPASTEILKDFSNGEFVYSEINGDYRIHNGIDFLGESGSPVRAIISGEVVSVTKNSSYGTIVEVDHGNNLIAKYCGLGNVAVEKGTLLNQGDKIGEITIIPIEGDKPHIHFETLLNGEYVDPLAVMGKAE